MHKKQLFSCFFIDLFVKKCYFIIIQKKKIKKESVYRMLEEKIKNVREKLNKSIENDDKYEKIYKLSIELDELIAIYYLEGIKQLQI